MKTLTVFDNFAFSEFSALLGFLKGSGCSFHSCYDLGKSPVRRGVSFRFDIHVRDIAGAYAFLAALYRYNIPGTFYLLASYSSHEQAALRDFLRLARSTGVPAEIGLHDSPVDAYLVSKLFSGKASEYWQWLKSDEAVDWFRSLAASPTRSEAFNNEVLAAFSDRVSWMRREFGEFQTVASHGGELNQMFRSKLAELGETGVFIASLFADRWMTRQRLHQAAVEEDVEQFRSKAPLLYQVSDCGGAIKNMVVSIGDFILKRNSSVQILIHPYTWAGPLGRSGGVRDAELSGLLGASRGRIPASGRKWYQRAQRLRLMLAPGGRRWRRARDPAADFPCLADRQRFLICASPTEIAADLEQARLPALFTNIIVVEEGNASAHPSLDGAMTLRGYLDSPPVCSDAEHLVVGASVSRYGRLVAEAIAQLVLPNPKEDTSPPARLAAWLKQELVDSERASGPVKSKLDPRELAYFMFSSSRRAQGVQRILDTLLRADHLSCVVDHGAGLAMIPLCLHLGGSSDLQQVVCSEIKSDFAECGRRLWRAMGCDDRLVYQERSTTDFVYPKSVKVILFAQVLFRLQPEERREAIFAAWQALDRGGLLIINELMDRSPSAAEPSPPTSRELLGSLPKNRERWFFWGPSGVKTVDALSNADTPLLRRADNFLVARKDR